MQCDNNTSLDDDMGGNSTDTELTRLVKYYFYDIAMPATCALGIVGNLLTLMVLTTEKLHRTLNKMEISAHIGLIALAVSDFFFCLLALITTQLKAPSRESFEKDDPTIYFHLMASGLITIFIISSTWLIVVMAAERYIAVCHPLQARKLISLRRTRACITLVFVLCTLATIPIFLEETIEDVCKDGRIVRRLTPQGEMPLLRIVWFIFFDFVPCVALIYFNLCLVIQIRRAKKLRDQMTPKHSVVRYSSSNSTKDRDFPNRHKNTPAKDGNCQRNHSLYPPRMVVRKTLIDHNLELSETKQTEMTNGASRHHKFLANRPKESNSGQENCSQGNESSQNDLRNLNEVVKPQRSQYSTASNRSRLTESIVRKRPSDNALNSVTATLVSVILLFLILVSPSELLKFSVEQSATGNDTYKKIMLTITNFMQVLNFSLNFVLYCAVNKTFRHTLYGLVCCCWLTLKR